MTVLRLVPVVVALSASPAFAVGETPPLPRYDVAAYCETLAAATKRSWDRHVCVKKEQSAMADAEPDWRMLTAKVRETCDHYAAQAGGSYAILGACLSHYVGHSKGRAEAARAPGR